MSAPNGTHQTIANLTDTTQTPAVPIPGAVLTFQYSTDGTTFQTDPNGGSATTDAQGNATYVYSLPIGSYTESAFMAAQTVNGVAYAQSNTANKSFQIQAPPRATQVTITE